MEFSIESTTFVFNCLISTRFSINLTLTKSRTKAAARENNQTYRQLASIIEDALSSVCDEIQQADRHQPLGKILSDIHKVGPQLKIKNLSENIRPFTNTI